MAKKNNSNKKIGRKTKKKDSASIAKFWNERKDVFKFLGSFLALVMVLFLVSSTALFDFIRIPMINVYAWISGTLLNLFSYDISINGDTLSASTFAINIKAGCDGIAPMILFWTTVMVFPVATKYKWKGLLYGTLFLFVLNVIRIITLFLAGVHARSIFDFLHVDLWQVIFIAMTIFTWLYWFRWSQSQQLIGETQSVNA